MYVYCVLETAVGRVLKVILRRDDCLAENYSELRVVSSSDFRLGPLHF